MVTCPPLFGDHSGMGIVLGGGGRDFPAHECCSKGVEQVDLHLLDPVFLRGRGTPNRHNIKGPGVKLAFPIRSSNWPGGWYKFLCLFDGHPLQKGGESGPGPHISRVTLSGTD